MNLERELCVVFACLLDLSHPSSPICSSVKKCMYARLASANAFTTFSAYFLNFKYKTKVPFTIKARLIRDFPPCFQYLQLIKLII